MHILTIIFKIFLIFYSDNLWIKIPLLSFGSNQVDFGGMIFPASATTINSFIEVGKSEKAAFISAFTLFSNSSTPLIFPTNSFPWSVRGFSIPINAPYFLDYAYFEVLTICINKTYLKVLIFRLTFLSALIRMATHKY